MLKPGYLLLGYLVAVSIPDLRVDHFGLHDEAVAVFGFIGTIGVELATVFVQLDAGVLNDKVTLTLAT